MGILAILAILSAIRGPGANVPGFCPCHYCQNSQNPARERR